MLNHLESASSAASVGAAISHSPMLNGPGLAIGTATTASGVIGQNLDAAEEIGHWFAHTGVGLLTYQQICTLIGTCWILICAVNMAYQLFKKLKSKPKKIKTTQGPVISGGSGSGHPKIDPR